MSNQSVPFQNGDIWTVTAADASVRPYISTTPGDTTWGSIDPVLDSQLSSQPGQLKANFYRWYDRLKLSLSGLEVSWSGYFALLPDGSVVERNAGSLTLPDNATRYVFLNNLGTVDLAPNLPETCVPLAYVTVASGVVTQYADLRYQALEVVRPIRLPAQAVAWQIGDIKLSARPNPEPGWLVCDGSLIEQSAYPTYASIVGTAYNRGDEPTGYLRLPNYALCSPVGTSSTAPRGDRRGQATLTLSIPNLPPHNHPVNETPHSHPINDPRHSHAVIDTHNHSATQDPHRHGVTARREGTGFGRSLLYSDTTLPDPAYFPTDQSIVPFQNNPNSGYTSLSPAQTGITVAPANTNLSTNPVGSAQPFSLYHPVQACSIWIRVS